MKIKENSPPRTFEVGLGEPVRMSDCAHIELQADEQVTFRTEEGREFDVARKSWGFYATPSLNGRLQGFGLRGVLVKGPTGKYFVWLVEEGKEEGFWTYLRQERHEVVTWLDTDERLMALSEKLAKDER